MNWLVKSILITLVLSLIVFLAWYFAQPDEVEEQTTEQTGESVIVDNFGLGNIKTITYDDREVSREIDVTEVRDDRLFVPASETRPIGEDKVLSELKDVPTDLPRLARLFAGQVAGYRIDQNEDGTWTAKVTEMGTGSRYMVNTDPYSLRLVSNGEVRKVIESHLFANDTVLLLYEGDDEFTIKSSFVPFNSSASPTGLQRFEDNIRAVTDHENKLFFTSQVNEKTVGVVVDVENPSDTTVVWESGFSPLDSPMGAELVHHDSNTDFLAGTGNDLPP